MTRGILINEIGHRYGLLTVVEFAGMTHWHAALWWCVCDCEIVIVTTGHDLRRGKSTNCGCVRLKRLIERNRERGKRNEELGIPR